MIVRSPERRDAVWHLKAARASLRIGCAGSALSELQRLLADERIESRYSPTVLRLAADAAIMLRKFAIASHYATLGYLLWPGRISFKVRLARIALATNRIQDAAEMARQILLEDPPRIDAKHLLAKAYDALDRPTDALRLYEDLLITHEGSRDVTIRCAAARAALNCNEPHRGLEILSSLVRPPRDLYARLLHRAGRLSEALDRYNRILADYGIPAFDTAVEPALRLSLAEVDGPDDELNEDELLALAIERIDVLDRLGRLHTLEEMARWELDVPAEDPRLRIRLAETLVRFGRAREAMKLVWRDRRNRDARWQVISLLLACAEILNRPRLADRCACMLGRKHRHLVIKAERAALMGSIMARTLPADSRFENQTRTTDARLHVARARPKPPTEFELLVRHARSTLRSIQSRERCNDTPTPDHARQCLLCEIVLSDLVQRHQSV